MLIVFDGSYMLHRSCHLPNFEMLQTTSGFRTGGAYGTVKAIQSILHTFHASRSVVVWDDVKRSERRMRIFPDYKGNRKLTPGTHDYEERQQKSNFYKHQRSITERLLGFLGVSQITLPCCEADDVVGVMVRSYKDKCVVVTADKDYFQLVSENVSIWNPHKQVHTTPENFQEVAGVRQGHFLLAKAILGDTSDNIPGVNGIGEKTLVEMMKLIEKSDPIDGDHGDLLGELAIQVHREGTNRQKKLLEQVEVAHRNLELMDLSKEDFGYAERCQILSSIFVSPLFQERTILDEFRTLQFTEFMRDFVSFSAPFRVLQ